MDQNTKWITVLDLGRVLTPIANTFRSPILRPYKFPTEFIGRFIHENGCNLVYEHHDEKANDDTKVLLDGSNFSKPYEEIWREQNPDKVYPYATAIVNLDKVVTVAETDVETKDIIGRGLSEPLIWIADTDAVISDTETSQNIVDVDSVNENGDIWVNDSTENDEVDVETELTIGEIESYDEVAVTNVEVVSDDNTETANAITTDDIKYDVETELVTDSTVEDSIIENTETSNAVDVIDTAPVMDNGPIIEAVPIQTITTIGGKKSDHKSSKRK